MTEEKLTHLSEKDAAEIKILLLSYPNVIEQAIDELRSWKWEFRHKFKLFSEEPILQKIRRMPPSHNKIIKKEIHPMLQADITSSVES